MEEKELKEYLVQMVLEYATQMNELELKYNELSEKNRSINYFPSYKKEYFPIFEKYCTNKKRVYGGQGDSYGFPATYDGIENSVESHVEIKTKSRAEVYFKTKNNFKAEYLFVVLRKSNEWKIDNVKYKWYEKEKWEPKIM